jgi:hypothetical protein
MLIENSNIKISKKYLIILVLKILETNTDNNNPLTQIKIADYAGLTIPS